MKEVTNGIMVLVCGGRTFADVGLLNNTLDRLDRERYIGAIVSGGCSGADQLAAIWAQEKGKVLVVVPAKWDIHGKAAGPMRNTAMLDMGPDLVVAFRGGKGTADTVKEAKKRGLNVLEVD